MRKIFLLLALLVFIPAIVQCNPLYILTAPNVLRVESEENAVVEAHGIDSDLRVEVLLRFFHQWRYISRSNETLTSNRGYISVPIKIPRDRIPTETPLPQYVVLEASSSAFHLKRIILISYQIGYIFIQTDKPIYTPTQTGNYDLQCTSENHTSSENGMMRLGRIFIHDKSFFQNPQGVIVRRNTMNTRDRTGITHVSFRMPRIENIGVWKIAASYKEARHINYTTEFEVKEYVLPSFQVILKPRKPFFSIYDDRLDVSITARFMYGEPVEGRAFVMFGVMKDGEKISIPSSVQSVAIINGHADVSLTSEALKTIFPELNVPLDCSIYITASVLTHAGSDMVVTEKAGIKIVTLPYTILFTKTSKYYKPGMPFDLMVFVTNPDGSPASGVPVTANYGEDKSSTQADGIARLTINTGGHRAELPVNVEANAANTPYSWQASANMVAEPYRTQNGSKNYLHIHSQPTELIPGNHFVVYLICSNNNAAIQNQIKYFTYMLISKGKIVSVGRQEKWIDQLMTKMLIPITPDLIPSFRLVVYYYLRKGSEMEMVADSIWADVKDTCVETLKVSAANPSGDNKIYQPGQRFILKLTGDPGATVGLVALDKAVFVLNKKNKLTQNKIWDVVEKNDIACAPGGGKDVFGVFSDAGLTFVTSTDIKTPIRTELECQQPMKRKRRSTRLVGIVPTKHLKRRQPMKGKRRSTRMVGIGPTKRDIEDDDEYLIAFEDIMSRTDFPESRLWILKTLPTNDRGSVVAMEMFNYHKDSITTWEVQAISMSFQKGICVAQPYEIMVKRDFFIDLRLPYSVVRNEQVEIRAILYNYDEEEIKARVEFPYNEKLCSSAKQTARFRIEVRVPAKGSIAVPYVIVPLIIGEIDIQVKASVYDRLVSDGVWKRLRVVPEGKRVDSVKTFELNPKGGQQVININMEVPHDVVPNTDLLVLLNLQGDILAQTIENTIDGAKLKHLIRAPSGHGEQNMASMTPVAIVTNYLDKTRQWERVGIVRRDTALKNIQQGFDQQLAYRKQDGSYAAFQNRRSSTWLTAYVLKVFAMSYRLIDIQPNVLCDAANWLILAKQEPDGHFKEDAPVTRGEMTGGIRGSDYDTSLTAFVLIAMIEAKSADLTCSESHENRIRKAGDYLENRIGNLQRAYSVAIATYALSLLDKDKSDILMSFASPDEAYWADAVNINSLFTIEATGYALLALSLLKKFDQASEAVKWLSLRSEYGGGFESTQATVVALQALSKYRADIPLFKDADLNVDIFRGKQTPIQLKFDSTNIHVARSVMVTYANTKVEARGKGQATLKVLTGYYALLSEQDKECKNFDLRVTVEEMSQDFQPQDVLKSLMINICTRHYGKSSSSMVIMEISILTGFFPDLDSLGNGTVGSISRFEWDIASPFQRLLIIYFDSLSNKKDTCFAFKIYQFFKVGLIQPASVKIYEYYDAGEYL
ncbi:complement C3-like [Mustelus asterias]